MKKELNKKIQELCDSVGTAAAREMAKELTEDLDRKFDERVAAGMSELNAFRDVLRNVDQIETMLKNLPSTEEEAQAREKKESNRTLDYYLGKTSSVMWVGTTVLFFLVGMGLHQWKSAWLVFLWATIGQIILGMTKDYNRGKGMNKVMRDGLSGILWVGTTMLFFLLGFYARAWSWAWLLFPIAVIGQILLGMFLKEPE